MKIVGLILGLFLWGFVSDEVCFVWVGRELECLGTRTIRGEGLENTSGLSYLFRFECCLCWHVLCFFI